MSWMIKGCLAWQSNGLQPPDVVKDATASYILEGIGPHSFPATSEAVAKFIEKSVTDIGDPMVKQRAIDRMRVGLVVDPSKDDTAEIAEVWRKCDDESAKVPRDDFDRKHATVLRDLVCDWHVRIPQ